MKLFKKIILYSALLLIFIFGVHFYIFSVVKVSGMSMYPTLQENDLMLLDRISYRFKRIQRFDIVVIKTTKFELVKRIIGLPGEHVEYRDNTLYINGKKLDEPIENLETTDFDSYTFGKGNIPEDYYLALGDNRMHSTDSRALGLIPKKNIEGKVAFTIYPFNRFGTKR